MPIFFDGRPAASLYDSAKQAESLVKNSAKADFFFVLGVTDGAVLKALLEANPKAKLLAFERSAEDLEFLKRSIPLVKKLLGDARVATCTAADYQKVLPALYFPSIYPKFTLLRTQNEWDEYLPKLQEVLDAIKSDFLTQSHFLTWWKYNFTSNKELARALGYTALTSLGFDTQKIALVVGAGPSLNAHLGNIKRNRSRYCIFSSDTAFKVLADEGIFCDAVFTVDANPVSVNHYMGNIDKKSIFIIDACSASALVRYLAARARVVLSTNGNPLALAEEEKVGGKLFLRLDSGLGSVLLSALDAAVQLAFQKIAVIGADFGNFDGKPYAKGTYLSLLYAVRGNRLESFDTHFAKLYYKSQKAMDAYKKSFLSYIEKNGYAATYENFVYSLEKVPPAGYN